MDEIKIDLSGLKIKDLILFDQLNDPTSSKATMIALLDKVVVGGASELPFTRLTEILEAVTKAVQAVANPKAPTA